ncbi:MAG TPA: class I SAM-dependent methyltransferase [Burkholderiales bacterium]|nr:class I SAM-dependent methyltransferase [Burkholderiales bacterium]
MNWAYKLALHLYERNLLRFLPWRFLRTYVYPITVRGRKKPYQAAQYFESYYTATAAEFSDRMTIGPAVKELHSRYHYNCVENSIIRALLRCHVKEHPAVFDLGSGAGHWIDFYLGTFGASSVYGMDISKTCVARLRSKYAHMDRVSIAEGDITNKSSRPDRKFDIVNAIGVVFHIVDDALWLRALINMRDLLTDDGFIVVGGQFGMMTRNVQFHSTDEFKRIEDMRAAFPTHEVRINKRIRSLARWKKAAIAAGLRVKLVVRTFNVPEIVTPENNVMILERPRAGRADPSSA